MPSENPLVLDQEEKVLQLFPRPPLLTSLQAGWNGIVLGYMCQPAYEVPEMYSPRWHSIAIFTHGNYAIHANRKLGERFHRDAVFGGDIVIAPANVSTQASWDAEGDFILIALEKNTFADAVDRNSSGVDIIPHFATPDPLIFQIGSALQKVLASESQGSRLYAETMANALSVHLLQHYSTRKPLLREYAGGLSRHQLQQVIDYINDYLDRDLGLAELAAVVQMSPHYFCHLFKQATGLSPHQYVIRCRVERAKALLLQGEAIADVAYKVGFANQSHLNRHFKRLIGVTPKQLQK
ncbi:helix-turn-helix domain-containing protein [Gloeocapsopsis dulcis]|uniref:AraC family transcriptional regulator n=1 Tax=Gloeocapsopsis dulcis AAB1 = 1H9 TaxID=1433147 RepID=A0A6N8FSU4_9CHRO|nr:AraC family transcriptional regulator [Gloeocapsopsis dulcis]MUL36011.1 AraC family transcriptional regulator [Gloeocapsopsis dulcis AAB1 = 1H9]WNN88264.1 AraC family transcriptional regulator [Gloeocapsopsis dulcis]